MDNIINKIFKVITEAKRKNVDPKLKAWISDRYGPWDDRDFISDDGDTYFKYEKTSEGGGISHKIVPLPSFTELVKQLKKTKDAANNLVKGESVRDDEVLRSIADELRLEFNKFRTHLRKEYPAFYAGLKGQLTEDEIDEMSTSGAAGAFLTPYAFKKPKKKQEPIPESHTDAENKKLKVISKELKAASKMHKGQAKKIDKIVKEVKEYTRVSKPRFIKDKKNPNFLNVYMDYDIGPGGASIALGKETMTGQIRRLSSDEAVRQMNNIAKKLNDNFDVEDIEVTDLENGKVRIFAVSDDFIDMDPRSELSMALLNESLDLNSYGYKLVPKNKAGNYVQKGSKLDVKQLFEDQKEYQDKRIAAFDVIEQEMNDIYKMLSNAKNETSEYYNDNPSSYTVIKPTDLVLDYIKDIKDLLKGE